MAGAQLTPETNAKAGTQVDPGAPADALPTSVEELLAASAQQIQGRDIAWMNLLCATGLPGSEDLELAPYLDRLERITEYVRRRTRVDVQSFRRDPRPWRCSPGYREERFRIGLLVTYLKADLGLHYNPAQIGPASSVCLGYPDSGDLLINGLLSQRKSGTCNSIPVIVVAVGRRLGYPLHLVTNGVHVWARWDAGAATAGMPRFNIEASNPAGFVEYTDEDYRRQRPDYPAQSAIRPGCYHRNLSPAGELAMFLFSRAWVLTSNGRFEESLPCWVRCLQLAPDDPMYAYRAHDVVLDVLYQRKHGRVMPRDPQRRPQCPGEILDARELLGPGLAAMAACINAHLQEVRGATGNAARAYRAACDADPSNHSYRADFDRYRRWIGEQAAQAVRGLPVPVPATALGAVPAPASVSTSASEPTPPARSRNIAGAMGCALPSMGWAYEIDDSAAARMWQRPEKEDRHV